MPNPFAALDSDDEGQAAAPRAAAAVPAKQQVATQVAPSKPAHASSKVAGKPRAELRKEEEDLQQKKKGAAGARGGQHGGPAGVTHPGERSKTGVRPPRENNNNAAGEGAGAGEKLHRRGHDRHVSGTGRSDTEKKGGAGGHNWGRAAPAVKPGGSSTAEVIAAAEPTEEGAAAGAEGNTEEKAAEPEVQDNTLTLEQYEAMRAAKRAGKAFESKPVAKPSTSVDGTKVYRKTEDEEDAYLVAPKKTEAAAAPAAEPKEKKASGKQLLNVDIRVSRSEPQASGPRTDRPPRGDRPPRAGGDRPPRSSFGAPRGGAVGGGGAPRQAAAPAALAVDDNAFPKLGA